MTGDQYQIIETSMTVNSTVYVAAPAAVTAEKETDLIPATAPDLERACYPALKSEFYVTAPYIQQPRGQFAD